ncbi:TPA: AAA family ATPase [Streptococcus suis]
MVVRLIAIIEEKNNEYQVINLLPDIIIQHLRDVEFEVFDIEGFIKIPYENGVDDLTVIVGENGVGKTNLINNIFRLSKDCYFIFESFDFENQIRKYSWYSGNRKGIVLSKNSEDGRQYFAKAIEDIVTIKFSTAIESYTEFHGIEFDLTTTHKLISKNILEINQRDMSNQIGFLFNGSELPNIDNFIFNIKDKIITTQLELTHQNNDEFLNYSDYLKTKFGDEDDQLELIMELYETDEDFSEYVDLKFYENEEYEKFLLKKYKDKIQKAPQYITYLEEKYNISRKKYLREIEKEETVDSIDLRQFILDRNNILDSINRMIRGYFCHILCCKNLDNKIEMVLKKFLAIVRAEDIDKDFSFLPGILKESIERFNAENFINLLNDVALELHETISEISLRFDLEIEKFTRYDYLDSEYYDDIKEEIFEVFIEFDSKNYAIELQQVWTEISDGKKEIYIEAIKNEFLSNLNNYLSIRNFKTMSGNIDIKKDVSLEEVRRELLENIPEKLGEKTKFEELFDNDLISIELIYLLCYRDKLESIIELQKKSNNKKSLLDTRDRNKLVNIKPEDILLEKLSKYESILKGMPCSMLQNFELNFLNLIEYDKHYIWFLNYYDSYSKYKKEKVKVLLSYLTNQSSGEFKTITELINYFSDEKNILFKLEDKEKLISFNDFIMTLNNDLTIEQNGMSFTKLNEIISFITFKWLGLSSGEHSLLNLFGRMFSIHKNLKTGKKLLILLDEVDIGLHPEWQRKWFSDVLPKIIEIFNENRVQIIMTTHSPIMLSDIYSENVIMLKKDRETGNRIIEYADVHHKTTFGQNIHQLFMNSFFLESTKGEYATRIINATIKAIYELNQKEVEVRRIKSEFSEKLKLGELSDVEFKKYLEKIINSIGEKVISKKLKIMFQRINFSHLSAPSVNLSNKMVSELSTNELRKILQEREEAE